MTARRARRERVWLNRERRKMREVRWVFGRGDWVYAQRGAAIPTGRYRPEFARRLAMSRKVRDAHRTIAWAWNHPTPTESTDAE